MEPVLEIEIDFSDYADFAQISDYADSKEAYTTSAKSAV
jgi:hypothetical protein